MRITPVFLLLLGACASQQRPAGDQVSAPSDEPRVVKLDPLQIQVTPDPLTGLDMFDAGDLLERGNRLYDARDFDHSAKVFDRLVERFPDSSLVPTALYNAGLAYENLAEHGQAESRFRQVIDRHASSAHAKDAYYRSTMCLSKLGKWKEVADTFWGLRQLPGLTTLDELEARVGTGVAMFMIEDFETAEKEFMAAITFHEEKSKEEYLPAHYWVAQARYYVGEIYARRFEAIVLAGEGDDTEVWKEKVGQQLEDKCQTLLRAQNNLIRAIRAGHPGWATAAGYRIGSMYERLYDDMLKVPAPPSLSEGAKAEYVGLLREKVAVLVTKAIEIYERSLEMAERVGEKNEWVERTAQALERMKTLALESLRQTEG